MGNVINLAEKREQVKNAPDPKMPKIKYSMESDVEIKFWHRVKVLFDAWQKTKQEDMKFIFKWKLIDIMKLIPGEIK